VALPMIQDSGQTGGKCMKTSFGVWWTIANSSGFP